MTTAEKNVNPSPHDAPAPQSPTNRVGAWFRARLDAYIATNEQALATPVHAALAQRAERELSAR